jgi:exodeoxyribonuclease VII large subunit
MNYITLWELTNLIKTTVQSALSNDYWIIAEIAKVNLQHNSGHCYMDLVEKQEDTIIAQIRAAIWARNYRKISLKFQNATGQSLDNGMKILLLAQVTYHEVYGLSLNIHDIDPRYTLGEMALKRQQIIDRLIKEGLIDLNKKIVLPHVMQNIAVISSVSAAGYGDFAKKLDDNPYGYRFFYKLFQAYVQGEQAEESIRSALKQCKRHKDIFDVVVIIRGGGSTVDLHCFDSYLLAHDIALFPLPVLTGIGHERDETVIDRVAHKRLMTPSAVAEFIISKAQSFEASIESLRQRLIIKTNTVLDRERHLLNTLKGNLIKYSKQFMRTSSLSLWNNRTLLQTHTLNFLKIPFVNLKAYGERLKGASNIFMKNREQNLNEFIQMVTVRSKHMLSINAMKLEKLDTKIHLLDPVNVLKRGYSITFLKGKAIKDKASVKENDIINTWLSNGIITSIVESVMENTNDEEP